MQVCTRVCVHVPMCPEAGGRCCRRTGWGAGSGLGSALVFTSPPSHTLFSLAFLRFLEHGRVHSRPERSLTPAGRPPGRTHLSRVRGSDVCTVSWLYDCRMAQGGLTHHSLSPPLTTAGPLTVPTVPGSQDCSLLAPAFSESDTSRPPVPLHGRNVVSLELSNIPPWRRTRTSLTHKVRVSSSPWSRSREFREINAVSGSTAPPNSRQEAAPRPTGPPRVCTPARLSHNGRRTSLPGPHCAPPLTSVFPVCKDVRLCGDVSSRVHTAHPRRPSPPPPAQRTPTAAAPSRAQRRPAPTAPMPRAPYAGSAVRLLGGTKAGVSW